MVIGVDTSGPLSHDAHVPSASGSSNVWNLGAQSTRDCTNADCPIFGPYHYYNSHIQTLGNMPRNRRFLPQNPSTGNGKIPGGSFILGVAPTAEYGHGPVNTRLFYKCRASKAVNRAFTLSLCTYRNTPNYSALHGSRPPAGKQMSPSGYPECE